MKLFSFKGKHTKEYVQKLKDQPIPEQVWINLLLEKDSK